MVKPPKEQAVNNTVNQEQDTEQDFVIAEIAKSVQELLQEDEQVFSCVNEKKTNRMFQKVMDNSTINTILGQLFGSSISYIELVKDLPTEIPDFDERHILYGYQLCKYAKKLETGKEIFGHLKDVHWFYLEKMLTFFKEKKLSLASNRQGEEHLILGILVISIQSNYLYYRSLQTPQPMNNGEIINQTETLRQQNLTTSDVISLGKILVDVMGPSDNSAYINNVPFDEFFNVFTRNQSYEQKLDSIMCIANILNIELGLHTMPQAQFRLDERTLENGLQFLLQRIDEGLTERYYSSQDIKKQAKGEINIGGSQTYYHLIYSNTKSSEKDNGYGRNGLFRSYPISHALKMIAKVIKSYGDGEYDKDKLKECLDAQNAHYLGIRHEKSMVKDAIMYGYFKRKSKNVSEIESAHWHFWCEVARRLFG